MIYNLLRTLAPLWNPFWLRFFRKTVSKLRLPELMLCGHTLKGPSTDFTRGVVTVSTNSACKSSCILSYGGLWRSFRLEPELWTGHMEEKDWDQPAQLWPCDGRCVICFSMNSRAKLPLSPSTDHELLGKWSPHLFTWRIGCVYESWFGNHSNMYMHQHMGAEMMHKKVTSN